MVLNREEAAHKAESLTRVSEVGICQMWTRLVFEAPSVGDRDRDNDADAVDGWLSESDSARHEGDRNPPRGVPVAFEGGGKGYGHRAVSLGGGKIRSTDMRAGRYSPLFVDTVTIDQIERSMGVEYLGWSETISGFQIPLPPKTRLQKFHTDKLPYKLVYLDRAISSSERTDKARLKLAVKKIEEQISRLPVDKDASLVNRVVADFEEERLIRLGLLNSAVSRGRMGVVRQVHDQLKIIIESLPRV